MKFWQFIISVIVIIIIHVILKIITNETAEDKYHREVHNDHTKLDDSPILKFIFKKKEDYQKIKKNVFENDIFQDHDNRIEKFNPNFKLLKEDILSGKSEVLQLKFIDKKKKFIMFFNHFYLGGDSFLGLKSQCLFQNPIKIPSSTYKSFLLIPKFIMDFRKFVASPGFEILPRLKKPKRLYEDLTFQLNEYEHFTKRHFVLYQVLNKLYYYLQLQRPMRVMVPVPFKRYNKINNNISALFLVFNGNESLEEFGKMFEEKKYMTFVTNFLVISKISTLFSNNQSIRAKIDAVVTSIYSNVKDDLNIDEEPIEYSLHWSTKVLPVEAVYTAVYSRIYKSHINTNITYTVSTSNFQERDQLKKYKRY